MYGVSNKATLITCLCEGNQAHVSFRAYWIMETKGNLYFSTQPYSCLEYPGGALSGYIRDSQTATNKVLQTAPKVSPSDSFRNFSFRIDFQGYEILQDEE